MTGFGLSWRGFRSQLECVVKNMTPVPEHIEPDWKHKLRAAALLALQRREEERKKRELAEVLRDWAKWQKEENDLAT